MRQLVGFHIKTWEMLLKMKVEMSLLCYLERLFMVLISGLYIPQCIYMCVIDYSVI